MICNYAYKGFSTFIQLWKIASSAIGTETKYYNNFAIKYNVLLIVILSPLYDRFTYFYIAVITYCSPWKP